MAVLTRRPPARVERRRRPLPDIVWTPLTVCAILLVLGFLSLAAGRPLLFPSLAPATVTHAATPRLRSARLYGNLVGQLLAIGAAYLAVWLTGAAALPPTLDVGALAPGRLWATALGVFLALVAQSAVGAVDPPSAATALLITFGGFAPDARDAGTLIIGVVLMALLGEWARRARDRQLLPDELPSIFDGF